MQKKYFKITLLAAFTLTAAGLFFIADSYAESSITLPSRFGNPESFVPEEATLYLEFPSLAGEITRFKKSPSGRRFLSNPLTRDFLIRSIERRALSLARSLRAASGLPIEENDILSLLEKPFALIMTGHGKTAASIGILKVSSSDRLLLSIFSRMGNALTGSDTLSRIKWSGAALYTVNPGKPGAITFALVNNVLLFSHSQSLIKKALRTAASPKPDRPSGWREFLSRNHRNSTLFCRAYFHTQLLEKELPLFSDFILPKKKTVAWLSASLRPSFTIRAGILDAPQNRIDTKTARLIPADALFNFSAPFPRFRQRLNNKIKTLDWGEKGQPLHNALTTLLNTLDGHLILTSSGLQTRGSRFFPAGAAIWSINPRKMEELRRNLSHLLGLLPDTRQNTHLYRGTRYRSFSSRLKKASGFDFCVAEMGGRYLCLTSTTEEMKKTIHSFLGQRRALFDQPAIARIRRTLRGAPLTRIASLNLDGLLKNIYSRLGDDAFSNPQYTRRDVMQLFGPILKTGLPWKNALLVGAQPRGSRVTTYGILLR